MDKQASLLGVQNNKLSTVQSDMLAENLEHSCSVVVENLVTSSTHDTCGDYCGTTAPRYLEVLEFTHFVTMFEFDGNGANYKNKKLIDRITVSVVLDLGCGNTTENVYESE